MDEENHFIKSPEIPASTITNDITSYQSLDYNDCNGKNLECDSLHSFTFSVQNHFNNGPLDSLNDNASLIDLQLDDAVDSINNTSLSLGAQVDINDLNDGYEQENQNIELENELTLELIPGLS